MKRIRIFLILCLSAAWIIDASCQTPLEKAAAKFISTKIPGIAGSGFTGFTRHSQFKDLYLFENLDPDFFVIVRKTDSIRIIGYSPDNRFVKDSINPGALAVLESLASVTEYEYLDNPLKYKLKPIGPFIQTRWGQDDFFNFYCPEDEKGPNGHVYTGCAVVAMAQILRYYGKFNDFFLTSGYTHLFYGLLTAVVGNNNWIRMENNPVTLDTEISRLMYQLGVLTNMGYSATSSSTSNFMVYDAFKKLKYFNAKRMIRSTTDRFAWVNNFYQNIMESKPIYVSGSGHSFICDGIDPEGLFHFNLGWSGYGDGYYPLDMALYLEPSEAIFDAEPYSTLFAPQYLVLNYNGDVPVFSWSDNPLSPQKPNGYRVYLNDTLYFETNNREINGSIFPPGNHAVMVSARYDQGESRWIGPIRITVRGRPVVFADPVLKEVVSHQLESDHPGRDFPDPTVDQVLTLSNLTINRPVTSLAGLESCRNLQTLVLAYTESNLDLSPISRLDRLKSLDLINVRSDNMNVIGQNSTLYRLHLENSQVSGISFLTSLAELIDLYIKNIYTDDPGVLDSLPQLERLTLSNCGITTAAFVEELVNLEYLDLSVNQISRIRWTEKLSDLRYLDLSHNELIDLFFLDKITKVRHLNLNSNQIGRFATTLVFPNLETLNIGSNRIDSLSFLYPVTTLKYLDAFDNRIRSVRDLKDDAPNLLRINLSGNLLKEIWTGSLQKTEYLDLSNNQITHLISVPNQPSLRHLAISGNRISDLYPLINRAFATQLDFADLSNNPLSEESMEVFAPMLREQVATVYLPVEAQPLSPGYPEPIRNSVVKDGSAGLSWTVSANSGLVTYDVLTGNNPTNLTVAIYGLTEPACSIAVDRGQTYYWAVRTIQEDTSFISGIFNFQTYQPVMIPYKDGFENYPLFSYIGNQNSSWIMPGQPDSVKDGRINSYRSYEGRQSMSINSENGLLLPLEHLNQDALYVFLRLLIENGKKAAVKLRNINGADLGIYFKSNGRCDIVFNQEKVTEVEYPQGQWLSLKFYFSGSIGQIIIVLDGREITLPWLFPAKIARVGSLEFSCMSGPYWPWDGFPLFYADNIEIKAIGALSTGPDMIQDTMSIYPNPADQWIDLKFDRSKGEPVPVLYDSSGRLIRPDVTRFGPQQVRINTAGLKPGVYYLKFRSLAGLTSIKILVCH